LLHDVRDAGNTVVAVHHDLESVPSYFDDVMLLNVERIAMGPVTEIFTEDNLRKTYHPRTSPLAVDIGPENARAGSEMVASKAFLR
jgi:manganese/zinc/iron transport system ATP- binding protein